MGAPGPSGRVIVGSSCRLLPPALVQGPQQGQPLVEPHARPGADLLAAAQAAQAPAGPPVDLADLGAGRGNVVGAGHAAGWALSMGLWRGARGATAEALVLRHCQGDFVDYN